jgi:DNA invertase Pin-like site-specific DNA recombinase
MQSVIAYYRVSTKRQGQSCLSLEAQRRAVDSYVRANDFVLVNEFIEINSSRINHKYALKAALRECKTENAMLITAKLDRLSRSVAFISMLIETHVDFKVVDNPHAEKFTLHILAAVAEKEREDISKRTSAALVSARLRGVNQPKP